MSSYAFAQDAVSVGLGALATIALFASVPASAGDKAEEKVVYSDLDLTSEAGQDTLDQRIRVSVQELPLVALLSEHLGHAQRAPSWVWLPGNLCDLALD